MKNYSYKIEEKYIDGNIKFVVLMECLVWATKKISFVEIAVCNSYIIAEDYLKNIKQKCK